MKEHLKILPSGLLEEYRSVLDAAALSAAFDDLKDADISTDTFSFYTSVASVYSSKIEGEDIEIDSYVKYKRFGIPFLPDYTKKTDDLYSAYQFARDSAINGGNVAHAHGLLAQHLLAQHFQGQFRTQNMFVVTDDGRIDYIAAGPTEVPAAMQDLYADIQILMVTELDITETFFFAGLIHLFFLKIYPFNDGNGRTGRLLEKWFLAQKLGDKAWFVQSEKFYYQQLQSYYNNIRVLGVEYPTLNYGKALPFLLMLPASILQKE